MKTYSEYLDQFFPGVKVQKISVNAGFSCPNRDGTIGEGGCAYCRNDSFSPSYCMTRDDITSQIEKGKEFFRRKYPEMKYLVYFQSYTNTHTNDISRLRALYEEALCAKDVVGIVIGTRPDTLPSPIISLLSELSSRAPVFLEIGAETSSDETLRIVNRNHTWHDVEHAVMRASAAGLHCGLHLIAGLPGEGERQILMNVENACRLPIETLKIHHLQVLKDTPMLKMWEEGKIEIHPFDTETYLKLCAKIVEMVPKHIVIERFLAQSPPDMVVAPKWGLKNYQFMNLLNGIISSGD